MNKSKKGQAGFSFVEILITLVIAGLIGIAGWAVLHKQKPIALNSSAGGSTSQANSAAPTSTSQSTPSGTRKPSGGAESHTGPGTGGGGGGRKH